MKKKLLLTLIGLSLGMAGAEDMKMLTTSSEEKILSPMAVGLELGALQTSAFKSEAEAETYMPLGAVLSITSHKNLQFNVSGHWLLPKAGWGLFIGADALLGDGAVRPFIGGGAGLQRVDNGGAMENEFGPAAYARAGVLFDVMDEFQLKVSIPWKYVASKEQEQMIGLELGFLFSSHLRKTTVKVLRP